MLRNVVNQVCPRCPGTVLDNYDEPRCVACGWAYMPLRQPLRITGSNGTQTFPTLENWRSSITFPAVETGNPLRHIPIEIEYVVEGGTYGRVRRAYCISVRNFPYGYSGESHYGRKVRQRFERDINLPLVDFIAGVKAAQGTPTIFLERQRLQ